MLPIFITLDKIPRHLIDASYDLGATELADVPVASILPLSLKGHAGRRLVHFRAWRSAIS